MSDHLVSGLAPSRSAADSVPPQPFEIIGHSVKGRPLTVQYCGHPSSSIRIFILAGQHGDESAARLAAAEFLLLCRSIVPAADISLAILVDANPDGGAALSRRNASDCDLNRDHLFLNAPETRAIHSFVHWWRPDLILDIHTYRPLRHDLSKRGFAFAQDVMLDLPNNPALCPDLVAMLETGLLANVQAQLQEAGIRCDRYTLLRPFGVVRHSTVDIVDARNGLSLRFDVPTILLEGRRTFPGDPLSLIPPNVALVRSMEAVVRWASANAEFIKARPRALLASGLVAVRCRYARSATPRFMEMQSAADGAIQVVALPGAYLPTVKVTGVVTAPHAYGVPRNMIDALEVLAKHRFKTLLYDVPPETTEFYQIGAVSKPSHDRPRQLRYIAAQTQLNPDDYLFFPTAQRGGRLLSLMLEPESQFGPHRFSELASTLRPGSRYPIARILS